MSVTLIGRCKTCHFLVTKREPGPDTKRDATLFAWEPCANCGRMTKVELPSAPEGGTP